MASSKSLRKGQFPIVCQLCEVDMKLKWKCEDCDLLMCDRCREKVHPKFKRAKEHHIIDFKQVGTCSKDLEPDSELLVVKCEKHTELDCCLFCQTCEQLICVSCVTKTHKSHELVEILEACKIKRELLAQQTETLETKLVELDEIETRVEQVKNVEMSSYEKAKKEIYDHQTVLKNEVDKYGCTLIEELDDNWQSLDQSLETRQKRVSKIRGLVQERLTIARTALAEKSAAKTLQVENRVLKELDQTEEQTFYLETISVPKFVPSNYKMTKKYFGSLQNTVESKDCNTVFKINRHFTTSKKMENVHFIRSYNKDLWIGHHAGMHHSLLQKVALKKNALEVVWSFDITINSIALNSEEGYLLVCGDESKLKQINLITGKISDSKYDVSPLVTRAVHVTKNNQIIIGAKNKGIPLPVSGRRAVIAMNVKGTQTALYEYDRTNKRLFTYVDKITSNSKGNIFIVDVFSADKKGRIVVLEQGRIDPLYIYSGCPEINSEQFPFKPSCLVSPPSDNVIVNDLQTGTLHILNSDGHLMSLFNLQNFGVYKSCSLALDPAGLLYVGCLKTNNDTDTAKVYELEYSGSV